jgi:serine/threonine protein phosphatase PrpC
VGFCKDEFSTKEQAQAIVKAAIDRGSKDNTSCLVLKFNTSPF